MGATSHLCQVCEPDLCKANLKLSELSHCHTTESDGVSAPCAESLPELKYIRVISFPVGVCYGTAQLRLVLEVRRHSANAPTNHRLCDPARLRDVVAPTR
eukprot:2051958-Amphidinium_carterae.1